MVTISTLNLLEANRKALEEGTLGAMKHKGEAKYRFSDGCHCALGAAFDDSTLDVLKDRLLNEHSIDDIIYAGVVQFEHYDIARWLQNMHDAWACNSHAPGSSFGLPPDLRAYVDREVCNRKVTEAKFRKFLDHLEDFLATEAA